MIDKPPLNRKILAHAYYDPNGTPETTYGFGVDGQEVLKINLLRVDLSTSVEKFIAAHPGARNVGFLTNEGLLIVLPDGEKNRGLPFEKVKTLSPVGPRMNLCALSDGPPLAHSSVPVPIRKLVGSKAILPHQNGAGL